LKWFLSRISLVPEGQIMATRRQAREWAVQILFQFYLNPVAVVVCSFF
jgi:transcription termination factor NusB